MERNWETRWLLATTGLQQVEQEIALMKKISHPKNLVSPYEPNSKMLYLVLEYMPLGEIISYHNNGTFWRKPPRPGQRSVPGLVNGHFFVESHTALYFVEIDIVCVLL